MAREAQATFRSLLERGLRETRDRVGARQVGDAAGRDIPEALDLVAKRAGIFEEAGKEEDGSCSHGALAAGSRRKSRTIAICDDAMSEGACPQPGISTRRAPGFTWTMVRATDSGKIPDFSPRRSRTSQLTRYHASHRNTPGARGKGVRRRVIFGLKCRRK